MNDAEIDALAAIRFFAENGRVDNVYKMLIRELGYSPDAALDSARWLTEHSDHAEIWIGANESIPPQIGFDDLVENIHQTGEIEYYIDHESFDQVFFRQIRTTKNTSIEIVTPLGRTINEAFDYWQAAGYAILLPILSKIDK